MKCLVCFLHDSHQSDLKKISQLQHDRFEDVIETYRDIFINELYELSTIICDDHQNEYLSNEYIIKILKHLKQIKKEDIKSFFNDIKDVYLLWINSDSLSAIEKLEDLLEKNNLFDFDIDISNKLMFRGRWSANKILTPYDMFHIPYDKRYLIGNQRFSLPGIPLLYLGTSPLDIYSELRANINEDIDKISISYFSFIKKTKKKIYDLTNDFYKILEENKKKEGDLFEIEVKRLNSADITKKFYKFIFMSFCSFEKRLEHEKNNFSMFHEEYILPQILTQVLKKRNFDGIQYSSTRLNEFENDFKHKSEYKNNIVLFTAYNKTRHYDYDLYKEFKISRPISYIDVSKSKITKEKLEHLNHLIIEREIANLEQIYRLYYDNFTDIELISIEKEEEKKITKTVKYNKHKIGKMHIFLIYNYLLAEKNKSPHEGVN